MLKIPDSFTSKKKNTVSFKDAAKNADESGELEGDKQNTCCSFCFSIYNLLPDQVKNTLARITIFDSCKSCCSSMGQYCEDSLPLLSSSRNNSKNRKNNRVKEELRVFEGTITQEGEDFYA